MNIVIRSSKTVRRKSVRAVRFTVLPILDPFLTISIYLFSAAVQPAGD